MYSLAESRSNLTPYAPPIGRPNVVLKNTAVNCPAENKHGNESCEKNMVTYDCNGFDVRVTQVFKVNHSMVISYNVLYHLISYNWMQQRK
jgi:hypothetical protein